MSDSLVDPLKIKNDFSVLNNLVVNNTELKELEGLIGGFNLFSVLGFESKGNKIFKWIKQCLQKQETQEVVALIAERLPSLGQMCREESAE